MIKVKLDVTKLDETAFFKGAKGTYVDLVLWECRDGKDKYGNDFAVKQDMPKERRGEKTQIIGSAKFVGTVQPTRTPAPPPRQETYVPRDTPTDNDTDQIPF